jgi:putative transcriptional regulator
MEGNLLIAEPFLKDESFLRSVVLLCKYSSTDGAFGFTINKKMIKYLHELFEDVQITDIELFLGGPVETDTLHFIHQYPNHFEDALQISEGVYWGGDFEKLKMLLNDKIIEASKLKFFLGYSGWSKGQLEEEIEEKTWILGHASIDLIFNTGFKAIWNTSLKQLGGSYQLMSNFPLDPQHN